jgi:hypothetical protein
MCWLMDPVNRNSVFNVRLVISSTLSALEIPIEDETVILWPLRSLLNAHQTTVQHCIYNHGEYAYIIRILPIS